MHIYKWPDAATAKAAASSKQLSSLPRLKSKKEWTLKIRPGVSTFGSRPEAVGEEHLKGLFDHALSIIPKKKVADTPIFLMATAGMRLLPTLQRNQLLREICSYARETTEFSLPDCDLHIQVIPGETEGLYGWIAANYLLGGFDEPEKHDHSKGHHTYGFLDMGGASAQIAFAPNSTEAEKHADDLKLLRLRTLNGRSEEYKVFVATWLGFGVNEARHRYVEALKESAGPGAAVMELPDPCLPRGLISSLDGGILDHNTAATSDEPYLMGQGIFNECLRSTYPLLDKDAPCENAPCLLNGQHVPAIDFDVNHFVGVSEYWHTTHEVFEAAYDDKAYDFNTYQQRVDQFCRQDWATIESGIAKQKYGKKVDQKTAMEVCFKASWIINVLHDGIGIPRIGVEPTPADAEFNGTKTVLDHAKEKGYLNPFQAVDKIEKTEVSWTLGKMVLYAAGQVEPTSDALPVGFGSNTGDEVPSDFQFAGSKWSSSPVVDDEDGEDDDEDWDEALDSVLGRTPRKSTGGIIALILVLFLVVYIFRKPERRLRLKSKLHAIFGHNRKSGSPRKGSSRGFFTAHMFGRGAGKYERVDLEDGHATHEFELADMESDDNEHSDSSEGSRVARSSGLATPKLNVVNDTGYFDAPQTFGMHSNISGLALPNAMDRSGLMIRTESRERLSVGHGMLGSIGRARSRAGSPTRKSPLMMPLNEND